MEAGSGRGAGISGADRGAVLGGARSERALDLGCAVGRSSFELSRRAREVLGIDYSQAFIEAARRDEGGRGGARLRASRRGRPGPRLEVALPEGVRPERVRFEQGDAMELRRDLGCFDRVLAANLLCRLREPGRLLARLPDLVRPGGELVLTTPCTWLEEFTPPGNWPADGDLGMAPGRLGRGLRAGRGAR